MATLIDDSASLFSDDPHQRTRSGSVEPECNNRTSPSSSFAAAGATTAPAAGGEAAAKPAEEDLWASLEKESVKRGIKFPSLRGSSSGGGAGGKWKRRGVHINPADEGMEEWEKVAALVTSSDSANATRPAAGLQWTSDASSASASSFLTPAASPGRRGSSADPPSRRRGMGLDDDDDEGGGGDNDDEESSDDDEEDNDDDNNSATGKEERRRKWGGGGGGVSISRSDDTTLFREKGSESSGGSGGSARFQRKKEKRESYTRLMELLVKDNLLLIEAICSSVLSHVEDEAEIILPELVRYMLSTQVATDIIVRLIRAEVLGAIEEGTILRGNEPISIMLTAHAKIVGHSFLCQMLKPEIALLCDEINQQKLHLEIDPVRMKTKGDVTAAVQENAKNLISVATRFLERIKSCLPLCPSQIRHISSEMRQCLMLRFPTSTVDSVLGGYIFLRLICPIIVSPDSAGMSGEDDGFYLKDGMLQKDTIRISPEAQRGLILLSKTLQQLANGTDFGWKEAFMLPLNSFLHESRPTMNAIFESVATPTTDGKNDDSVALEKGEIHLIKFIFHRLVYIGMDHIEAFVREREAKRNEKSESPAAAVEGKRESESEGESDAMKIVDELRHVMRVLGKPPRSLRKYRDIVFYEAAAAHSKSRHDDDSDEKKMKKSKSKKSKKMMKKMKRREKKEKKDKKEKDKSAAVESTKRVRTRSGIARLGRARAVRAESGAGVGGGDVTNKWKSDSCSKVSLVLDRNKQRDLKSEAIVRRVRSSDQRADDNVEGDADTEGGEVVSSSGGEGAGGDGGAESEGGLVEYSSDDDSYSSDFFDDSDDDADLASSPTPSRHALRSAASSVAEEDMEKEREEKIRKKAEIAKKLLEEKYKSYSMRNLRSERAAMKKERQQPLTSREEASKKRDGRSITLSDLQVVKRERDNEVLRSVGPLSPRGRNLTSPPAQHHQINRHDLSSSSSSESSSEDESPRPPPQTARTSKLGSRMPSLRIPTREDFKFLSPRRPAPGAKHNN